MLFWKFGLQYIIFILLFLTYAKPTKNHNKSRTCKITITGENSKGKRKQIATGLYCWNKHKGRNFNFETMGSGYENKPRSYGWPTLFIVLKKAIYARTNCHTTKKRTSKKLFIRNLWKLCTELIFLTGSRSGFGKPRKTKKWYFYDKSPPYFV